ncbi:hypothetical protein IFM46972_03439, partial [Aspergillus udagawae]
LITSHTSCSCILSRTQKQVGRTSITTLRLPRAGMVYCGKPSKACLECRVKRRRCNLSRPSCGQCLRAGAKCGGYRDPRSLLFRDQSAQVICQAGTAQPGVHKRNVAENQLGPEKPRQCQQKLILSCMNQSIFNLTSNNSLASKDEPLQLFVQHYLLDDTPPSGDRSNCFEFIYSRTPAHSYLSSAVDAIGIASLANLHHAPHLRQAAHDKYAFVLREIRLALANPDYISLDQVLVTVMLLNLFETVTCENASLSSWNQHLGGALAIIQLRKPNQLQDSIMRNIFLHLRREIISSCLQQKASIPSTMARWMAEFRTFETVYERPSGELADIITRICTIVSSVEKHICDTEACVEYIPDILSIDEALTSWSAKYTNGWTSPEGSRDARQAHTEQHSLYHSISFTNDCNLCCCARIILHETLVRIVSQNRESSTGGPPSLPSSLSYNHLLTASYAATRSSISSICYSVLMIRALFRNGQIGRDTVKAGCGVALIWPLFLAGTIGVTTASEREWIALQLREIAETCGIQRAQVAASYVCRSNRL